jgi:hypothetical protein
MIDRRHVRLAVSGREAWVWIGVLIGQAAEGVPELMTNNIN